MKKTIDNPNAVPMIKKEFYEHYALEILKTAFPEKFNKLTFVGGNSFPDLQYESAIGVEVTCAFDEELTKISSYNAKFGGAKIDDISQNVIDDMARHGFCWGVNEECCTDVLYDLDLLPPDEKEKRHIELIKRVGEVKIDKLNKEKVVVLNEINLFICLPMNISYENLYSICHELYEYQQNKKRSFLNFYFLILTNGFLYHATQENDYLFGNYISSFQQKCFDSAYVNSGQKALSEKYLKKTIEYYNALEKQKGESNA